MKILIRTAIFSLFTLAPISAYAEPGDGCHFHGKKPVAEETVLKCATQRKDYLVKDGKLDKNWVTVTHTSIAYVAGKKGQEWKVSFTNPAATDQAKNTLYMFFTPPGNFIAANYTGK